MDDHFNLELEGLLRHLIHTEPKISHWMETGNVERGALNGLVDADTFRSGTEEQIAGLITAIKLLSKKVAYLEGKLSE